ncbi:MAG: hypothetical protein RIB86_19555 [Imperialibacter sp.]
MTILAPIFHTLLSNIIKKDSGFRLNHFMGIFSGFLPKNKFEPNPDEVYYLIREHTYGFIEFGNQRRETEIEGQILLLSAFLDELGKKTKMRGDSPTKIIAAIVKQMNERVGQDIFMRLISANESGTCDVGAYIVTRMKYYFSSYQIYENGNGLVRPIGICKCLYESPLKILTQVDLGGGVFGFKEEFELANVNFIQNFIETFPPIRDEFIRELNSLK